jgi:integrase
VFKRQDNASSTVDAYDDALRLHVLPALGSLRVRELTVGVADRFLSSVRDQTGASAAKHTKTVLSSVMGLAARNEAIDHNPMRDVSPISVEHKEARSLELAEVRALRTGLRIDEKAADREIPAIVDFMLGTGLRIGEVLAATWDELNLEARTVEVRATVVRRRGVGLVLQPKPKTRSGVAGAASAAMAGRVAQGSAAGGERVGRGVSVAAGQAAGSVQHEC